MAVQAKVRCISATPPHWDPEATQGSRVVRFTPVYDSNPEHPNFKWSQATPAGYFEMHVTNPDAAGAFVENEEYLVTFEKV
jgi:hypothetical protein